MSGLSNNPTPNPGWNSRHVATPSQSLVAAAGQAPGRETTQLVRKELPDGRVYEFLVNSKTMLEGGVIWKTDEVIEVRPPLDCPCTPESPDDIAVCDRCQAAVCKHGGHSGNCECCGKTFCSACLTPVVIEGISATCCRPCAEKATASLAKKVFWGARSLLWGD